jgi:hypothetical protein
LLVLPAGLTCACPPQHPSRGLRQLLLLVVAQQSHLLLPQLLPRQPLLLGGGHCALFFR